MALILGDKREHKSDLILAAYKSIAALWERGDAERFRWVHEECARIERAADEMGVEELRQELRFLFKRIAHAKGRRGLRDSGRAAAPNPAPPGAKSPEESNMPIELQVKDVSPVSEGQHNAVIRSVVEKESKFSDSRHDTYLAFQFEIIEGKDKGRTLARGYTPTLSSKSNLGQLWRRLKGSLPVGETVDVEELIGEEVHILVAHDVDKDGEVRERIADVLAPLKDEAVSAR